jgi:type II secretory pathway component GspD/PulD (secretin)
MAMARRLLPAAALGLAGVTGSPGQAAGTDAAGPPEMAVSDDGAGRQLISVLFDNQPLDVVVGMFNRMPGVNLIANPGDLTGRVSVTLRDVPWKAALIAILDMHGLMLHQKDPAAQIFTIIPRAPDAPEPQAVRSFALQFASAEDVADLIRPMLSPLATVAAYPAANLVVVKAVVDELNQIEQIIQQVDESGDQVFIEAKFMELNDQAIEDLGINWQALEGISAGASGGSLAFGSTTIRADRDERIQTGTSRLDETDRTTREFDASGREVVQPPTIEFQEIPGTDPAEYIRTEVEQPIRILERERIRESGDQRTIEDLFDKESTLIRTAVLDVEDFNVLLSALRQKDGISIVSNPKIVVSNGKPAVIHIGETERPFISSVTPGQQGIAPVVTYNPGDPVDFGVKLTVTPTVNNQSNITVRIQPELTRFVRDAVAPNGQTYPIVSTKRIETVFSLESGRTVAIGGLTETEDREENTKVPLLGDVPVVGKYLFSHSSTVTAQKETIIFVTVGIARPERMHRAVGLPEDTELTRMRLIDDQLRREQHRLEVLRSGVAAQHELRRLAAEQDAAVRALEQGAEALGGALDISAPVPLP